jgi:NhaP-type Na+/H+ or K+/H+ antiporter
VLLAGTFLSYGLTEAISGYGFLAVFACARTSRAFARGTEHEQYAELPHRFSDQVEKVLLAFLLVWLGGYAVSGLLNELRAAEVGIALLLLLVLRPVTGYLALLPTSGTRLDRAAIGSLGIRGFGSVFYLAYGQSHGHFASVDSAWRICVVTIVLSILIHSVAAQLMLRRLDRRTGRTTAPDG